MLDVQAAAPVASRPRVAAAVSPLWIDTMSASSLAHARRLRATGHPGPIRYLGQHPAADPDLIARSRAVGIEPIEYDQAALRSPDGSALQWQVNDLLNTHLRAVLIETLRDSALSGTLEGIDPEDVLDRVFSSFCIGK